MDKRKFLEEDRAIQNIIKKAAKEAKRLQEKTKEWIREADNWKIVIKGELNEPN